jgi:hypothetical protein
MIRRRDLFLLVPATGVAAAVLMGATSQSARTDGPRRDKRRPMYQANSPEVRDFYRVNRYPAK